MLTSSRLQAELEVGPIVRREWFACEVPQRICFKRLFITLRVPVQSSHDGCKGELPTPPPRTCLTSTSKQSKGCLGLPEPSKHKNDRGAKHPQASPRTLRHSLLRAQASVTSAGLPCLWGPLNGAPRRGGLQPESGGKLGAILSGLLERSQEHLRSGMSSSDHRQTRTPTKNGKASEVRSLSGSTQGPLLLQAI